MKNSKHHLLTFAAALTLSATSNADTPPREILSIDAPTPISQVDDANHESDQVRIMEFLAIAEKWLNINFPAENAGGFGVDDDLSTPDRIDPGKVILHLGNNLDRIEAWLASLEYSSAENRLNDSKAYAEEDEILGHVRWALSELVTTDTQTAIAVTQLAADYDYLYSLLVPVIDAWSATDPLAALDWIKSNRNDRNRYEWHVDAVFGALLHNHPESLLTEIEAMPEGNLKTRWLYEYAAQLAEQSYQTALDWVVLNSKAEVQREIIEWLEHDWSVRDSAAYLDFLDMQSPLDRQNSLENTLSSIVMNKATEDVNAALEWADTLDESMREKARIITIGALYWESPTDALNMSHAVLTNAERDLFFADIAFDLARHDMTLALSFFDRSDSSIQDNMAYSIVHELGIQSVDDAQHWIDQLPSERTRMNATKALIDLSIATDPIRVLPLLGSIEQTINQDEIEQVYFDITLSSRDLVTEWITTGVLTNQQQQSFTSILEKIDNGEYERGC